MSVLSLDPGKTTGWALWRNGVLVDRGAYGLDATWGLLEQLGEDVNFFVVEGYRLDHRAGKQKGSELEAVQVIGAVKFLARSTGAFVVLQQQESRDMAYLHSGTKKATQHKNSHHLDAVMHGYWWLESQGVVPDISLLRLDNDNA